MKTHTENYPDAIRTHRLNERGSGVLLHITSLPSRYGIGDLGPAAYAFADFLAASGQHFWQILPLNPTSPDYDNCPYQCNSVFAYNPILISPDKLVKDGFLTKSDIKSVPEFSRKKVEYRSIISYKTALLNQAYKRFRKRGGDNNYKRFCDENSYWLVDYALFTILYERYQKTSWNKWPESIAERRPGALRSICTQYREQIEKESFFQYIFAKQWSELKLYLHEKKISVVGDMPIYVQFNSADLWANPCIFKLNKEKNPSCVAGVPPDYFSETGQLWGNPVYNWKALRADGYKWWLKRITQALNLFDIVRIDHFRGLVSYWEVPAGEKTALNGKWVNAPAKDFLRTLFRHVAPEQIIAEDLGYITPDVYEIIRQFNLTGMKVLQFGFDGKPASNNHAPHSIGRNYIVYTGTHDNNTVRGWYDKEASKAVKKTISRYLYRTIDSRNVHKAFIRLAMMSAANVSIIPMQDFLGLGGSARMNQPATTKGNWRWRMTESQMTGARAKRIAELTELYGRAVKTEDEINPELQK